jgi:hypothetical protein
MVAQVTAEMIGYCANIGEREAVCRTAIKSNEVSRE